MSELELAAIVEGGTPSCKPRTSLKGMYVYDLLLYIQGFIGNLHLPLIDDFVDKMVEDIDDYIDKELEPARLTNFAVEVLRRGFDYFYKNLLAGDVGVCLPQYKAVRMGNPAYVKAYSSHERN